MADEKQEKMAAKVKAAIEDANRDEDGNVQMRVTLLGDGVISKGGKPGDNFEDGDTFFIDEIYAESLALKGYCSPVKAAKKAKKAA